jgi:hypothetical protein
MHWQVTCKHLTAQQCWGLALLPTMLGIQAGAARLCRCSPTPHPASACAAQRASPTEPPVTCKQPLQPCFEPAPSAYPPFQDSRGPAPHQLSHPPPPTLPNPSGGRRVHCPRAPAGLPQAPHVDPPGQPPTPHTTHAPLDVARQHGRRLAPALRALVHVAVQRCGQVLGPVALNGLVVRKAAAVELLLQLHQLLAQAHLRARRRGAA